MTGQAIAAALNGDTGGITVNQDKITGLTDKLAEIATNKASATQESQDALRQAKEFVTQQIAALVDSASEEYNTFKELETFIKQNAGGLAAISNVAKKISKTFGDAQAKEFTITHSLNTRDVNVTIRETNSPYAIVYADIKSYRRKQHLNRNRCRSAYAKSVYCDNYWVGGRYEIYWQLTTRKDLVTKDYVDDKTADFITKGDFTGIAVAKIITDASQATDSNVLYLVKE
ncbi:phage protein [Streptococcus dysgalactiae]|nr:phage protein [Streptococcus dysgalactiae]